MIPLAISLLLASPSPIAAASPPLAPLERLQEPIDIQHEVDRSLRWLRTQQDAETGSYGSVRTTLLVLEAFSDSPRGYVASDGPYVSRALDWVIAQQREDGAIADPATEGADAILDTRLALRLFERLGAPEEVVERARTFAPNELPLFHDGMRAFFDEMHASDQGSPADVDAYLRPLLGQRTEEGYWDGPAEKGGPVQATALALFRLNGAHHYLKGRSKPTASAPRAAEALPAFAPADRDRAITGMRRGAAFLLGEAIEPGRWGFGGEADPGLTAMVATALLGLPEPRSEEVRTAVEAALDWLSGMQREDGSIHDGTLANYVTSASVMAMVRAGRAQDAEVVSRAKAFLRDLQADEGEGYGPADRFYGGVGYGGDERPDLSNMNMALEALHDAGLPSADDTFQKALAFLQRCQNRSESNDYSLVQGDTVVASGNDGGAGYAPGDSKAGFVELADGRKVPRSYGSMTYALLKGYLFAGLPKDDPRVEAAWGWLTAHYTLDVNPGFEGASDPTAAYQGLFYYFTTMAKALDLYGEEIIEDAEGGEHAWRGELVGRVLSLQRQDGSWVNANAPRWYEGNPTLASAYALITLAHCLSGGAG